MRRNFLDTAGLIVENKSINTKFVGSIPLNQEHGLRNMYFNDGGYLPKQITIPTLTEDQINEMIEKETNEKVKQGLRTFVRNRTNYQYDSSTDTSFVYNFPDKKETVNNILK